MKMQLIKTLAFTLIAIGCGNDGQLQSESDAMPSEGLSAGGEGENTNSDSGSSGSQLDSMTGISTSHPLSKRLNDLKANIGPIMVTLVWANSEDLDLSVKSPGGEEINWEERVSTCGGALQLDANSNSMNTSSSPIEHIYWQPGKISEGQYTVQVGKDRASNAIVKFVIYISIDGKVQEHAGVFNIGERGLKKSANFTIDSSQSIVLNAK